MSVSGVAWPARSACIGAGTLFGEMELGSDVLEHVDRMIDVSASGTPLADLLTIEREAENASLRRTFEAAGVAITLGGIDPDKLFAIWRAAANYGAASTMAVIARRCGQLHFMAQEEGGSA